MSTLSKRLLLNITAAVAYVVMIVVNALSNILPINNLTTGAVSDAYPNLFAPAGVTFSIWGLIYLLLGAYVVYLFAGKPTGKLLTLLEKVNVYFIVSSLINATWIFSWHYRVIWLSVLLMFGLLYCLIKIADLVRQTTLTTKEKLFVKVPFGVYFGWITIATIANITVFLVSIGWDGFGIADTVWMMLVLLVGVVISSWRMLKDNNLAYGLVPVWAYFGILLKHTAEWGFNNQYPNVIATVWVCLAALVAVNGYLVWKKRYL